MTQNTSAQRQKSDAPGAESSCSLSRLRPSIKSKPMVFRFSTAKRGIRRRRWFCCCTDFLLHRSCIAN